MEGLQQPIRKDSTRAVETEDSGEKRKHLSDSDSDADDQHRKKKKKDKDRERKRSRDRDDDRKRSRRDSRDRDRSKDRHHRSREGSDRDRSDRDRGDRDRGDRDRSDKEKEGVRSIEGQSRQASSSDLPAPVSGNGNGDRDNRSRRSDSYDRRRDDRYRSRDDSRDRYRDRGGDRGRDGEDRSRRNDARIEGGRNNSSNGSGAGAGAPGVPAPRVGPPKPVTLKEVMAVNPGISMPEAVMKLNAYNTAVARGEDPGPLSGLISLSAGPAILPLGMQNLSSSALGAVTSAAGVSLGEGGSATKPHREIYVGNLPPKITVPQLTEFLNSAMKQLGYSREQDSVITSWISPEGTFAFAELRTVEEANAALNQLNGVQIGSFALRIGRPKGYNGGYSAVPMLGGGAGLSLGVGLGLPGLNTALMGMGIPGMIPGMTEALSNVIMCTNLSQLISAEQVKELFMPFGELKAFNIIQVQHDQTQAAVMEFADPAVNEVVVQGMHKLQLADMRLWVQRVPQSSAALLLQPSKEQPVKPPAVEEVSALTASATQSSSSASTAAVAVSSTAPKDLLDSYPSSSVLRLGNLTRPADLADEATYSDLTEDVADECNAHGVVKAIVIPRDAAAGAARGQVFVSFVSAAEAERCLRAVVGRRFAGKTVVGHFFPEELFQLKMYDVPHDYLSKQGTYRPVVQMSELD